MKKIFSLVFGLVLLYPVVMGAKICQLGEMNGDGADSCSAIVSGMSDTSSANGSQSLSFSNQDLGWKLPFTIGAQYSKLGNYGLQAKLAQGLNAYNAYALDLELAKSERRYSATFGHAFNDNQRLKFTAEYLTQNLDFDFTTGKVSEWVGQPAYGLAYQYVLSKGIVNAINLNVAYSKADSKTLSTISDSVLGISDYRRIAGGEDRMASVGVDLLPFDSSLVNLELDYDSLRYNTKYDSSNSKDRSGLGATAKLEQVLTDFLKVKLSASSRKPNQQYQAEIDWLMPALPGNRIEMALVGGHTIGSSGLPNNTNFGLNINYSLDPDTASGKHAVYGKLGARKAMGDDLVEWTKTPAVRMAQVLAIKDELVLRLSALNPASGPCAGNTPVIISGSGFGDNNSVASVIFGGLSGSKVSQDSSSQVTYKTPAHPAGKVDVTLTRTTGETVTLKNAYEFLNSGSCVFVDESAANNKLQGSNASTKEEVSLDEGGKALKVRCTGFQNNANNAGGYSVIINGKEITNVTPSQTDPNEMSFVTPDVSDVGASTQSPLKVKVNMPGIVGQEVDGTLTYYGIIAILDDTTGNLTITADAPNPVSGLFTLDPAPKIYLDGQTEPFSPDLVHVSDDGSTIILGALNGQRIKVIVRNKGGNADAGSASYDAPPEVSSITPNAILEKGGNRTITILGNGFTLDAMGKHQTHILFNGVDPQDAITYTVSESKIVITKVPSGKGEIQLTVQDPGGKSFPVKLTYYGLGFTDASKHMPNEKAYIRGSLDTGKTTQAVANLFSSDAMLKFGDKDPVTCSSAPDAPCTVDTSTGEISFTIPDIDSKNTGDVPVAVNVTNKQDSLAADSADATFSYLPAKPVLVDAKPLTILRDGGLKTVTIQGNNLAHLLKQNAVRFNSVDVTSAVDPKDTDKSHISFKYSMPKHDPGSATFKATVATEGGTTAETDLAGFTYSGVEVDKSTAEVVSGQEVKLNADQSNSFTDSVLVKVTLPDSSSVETTVHPVDSKTVKFNAPVWNGKEGAEASVVVTNLDKDVTTHLDSCGGIIFKYKGKKPSVNGNQIFNWLETIGADQTLTLQGSNLTGADKVTIADCPNCSIQTVQDDSTIVIKGISSLTGTSVSHAVVVHTAGGDSDPVNITIHRDSITSEFPSKVKDGIVTVKAQKAQGAVFSDTARPTINVHFDFDGHDVAATVLSVGSDGKSLTFKAPTTIKQGANEVVSAAVTVTNPAGDSALTSIEYAAKTPAIDKDQKFTWLKDGAVSEVTLNGQSLSESSKLTIDGNKYTIAKSGESSVTIENVNLAQGTHQVVVTTPGGESEADKTIQVNRIGLSSDFVGKADDTVHVKADADIFAADKLPQTIKVDFKDGTSGDGTDITYVSPTEITFKAPPTNKQFGKNEAFEFDVTATMLAGDFAKFTIKYGAKTPKINSITPNHGPEIGRTSVTINGSNFVDVADVTIGGLSLADPVISETEITGKTLAHASGAVDVVVTLKDGQVATLKDGFTYDALESIIITPSETSVAAGLVQKEPFVAKAHFKGEQIAEDVDVTDKSTWEIGTGADFAQIVAPGKAKGIKAGKATVIATFNGKSDEGTLLVTAPELEKIDITPATASIHTGQTAKQLFTATGTYTDRTTSDITTQVTWKSSDKAVAGDPDGGTVTGIKAGSTTITATNSDGSITSNDATLTVTDATLTKIEVEPTTLISLPKGATDNTLRAYGTYNDGSPRQDISSQVHWASSAETVASVKYSATEQKVLVHANNIGEGTITADLSGQSSNSVSVQVGAAVLKGILVSPTNPTIMVDEIKQFLAFKEFTDGTTQHIVDNVSWDSHDPKVAEIDGLGTATGKKGGSTEVKATFNDGSKVWTSSTTLTVKDLPPSIDPGQTLDWLQDGGKRTITIYGNHLSGVQSVSFDVSHGVAKAADDGKSITIEDVVTSTAKPSLAHIKIDATGGTAESDLAINYHPLTIDLPHGHAGTHVTITTDNIAATELFAPNPNVTFGTGASAKSAENINRVDGHTITCDVPNLDTNSAETVPVTVQNQDRATDSATTSFTYGLAPVLDPLSGTSAVGLTSGGKIITINGNYLKDSTVWMKDGTTESQIASVTPGADPEKSLSFTAQGHAKGAVNFYVKSPEGVSSNTVTFTYYGVGATVNTGIAGTAITIKGKDANNQLVDVPGLFSSSVLPDVEFVTPDRQHVSVDAISIQNNDIVGTVPSKVKPGTAVDLIVKNKDAQWQESAVAPSEFTYNTFKITDVDKTAALSTGQSKKKITITGDSTNHFNTYSGVVTKVEIGNTPATEVTVQDATHITAVVPEKPASIASGSAQNIKVIQDNFIAVAEKKFTYYDLKFTADSQTVGPMAGGTDVTITASDPTAEVFDADGFVVDFGTVLATEISPKSTTSITLKTPKHDLGGKVTVKVINTDTTNGDLDSAKVLPDPAFEYSDAPVVDSVTRNTKTPYVLNGGGILPTDSEIVITGKNLRGQDSNTQVTVDGDDLQAVIDREKSSDTNITLSAIPVFSTAKTSGSLGSIKVTTSIGHSDPAILQDKDKLHYVGISYTDFATKTGATDRSAIVSGHEEVTLELQNQSGDFPFASSLSGKFDNNAALGASHIGNKIKLTTPPHPYGDAAIRFYNGASADDTMEHAIAPDTNKLAYHRTFLRCPDADATKICMKKGDASNWSPDVYEGNWTTDRKFTVGGAGETCYNDKDSNLHYEKFQGLMFNDILDNNHTVCRYTDTIRSFVVPLAIQDMRDLNSVRDKAFVDFRDENNPTAKEWSEKGCTAMNKGDPRTCTLVYTVVQ